MAQGGEDVGEAHGEGDTVVQRLLCLRKVSTGEIREIHLVVPDHCFPGHFWSCRNYILGQPCDQLPLGIRLNGNSSCCSFSDRYMYIRPVHKNLFLEFPQNPGSFMLHFDRQTNVTLGVLLKYRSFIKFWEPPILQGRIHGAKLP